MVCDLGRSASVDDEVGAGASGRMSGRIEAVAQVSGRRACTVEQKLAVLHDAFSPNGSVCGSIERHEISSGLPFDVVTTAGCA